MCRRKSGEKDSEGHIAVEAVILLPICVLCILLLLYIALFLFQRACLQAALETGLVYYKNTVTDSYVMKNDRMDYLENTGSRIGAGNSYHAGEPLSPYRGMFGDGNNLNSLADFEEYFRSTAGGMVYEDQLILSIDYSNFVYLKQLEVTAVQQVNAPIDFGILGIGNEYTISAAARVAVVDHDSVIRDADYAIDLIKDTKLGEMARELASKISSAYGKMKEFFGA